VRTLLAALMLITLTDVVEEYRRRDAVLAQAFEQQRHIIESAWRTARLFALTGNRRSGKTNVPLIWMVEDAKRHPGADYAYIALTKDSGERIAWKELCRVIDAAGVRCKLVPSRLRVVFPGPSGTFADGGVFQIYGADKHDWFKKFRGGKYRGVMIDECQSYSFDLEEFVMEVVDPTLTDWDGVLWLLGTPGKLQRGYWYKLTQNDVEKRKEELDKRDCTYHFLDNQKNPAVAKQVERRISKWSRKYGDQLELQAWFQREWRGRWYVDLADNVYKFNPVRNSVEELPSVAGGWRYVCGMDFGHSDATAFVVVAWSPNSPIAYVIYSYAQGPRYATDDRPSPAMQVPDVGKHARKLMDQYPGLRLICDPANKTLVEELRTRERLPLEDAAKADKHDWIRVCNSDFSSQTLMIVKPELQHIGGELVDLKKKWKDKEAQTWEEHPKLPNDACDAMLYAYRGCYHFRYEEPGAEPPKPGSVEHAEMIAKDLHRKRLKKMRGDDGGKHWFERRGS